jgi:hypothetical protein
LLLLIAGGYRFAGEVYSSARDLVSLREDRDSLAAEVERLKMKLAVESATRVELEQQAVTLNAQVAELNGQVRFLMNRRASDKVAD